MAKQNGLGASFFHNGYDVTTDIKSVDRIGMPSALLDKTSIDKSAMVRMYGLRDGEMLVTAHFDDAAGFSHPVFSALPRTDVHQMYCHRSTLASPAAAHIGKQINYDPVRSADGDLVSQVQVLSNLYPVEWGKLLTAGSDNATGAANTTGVDFGAGTALNIADSNVDDSISTSAAHGLTTNDRVSISGHDSTPSVDGLRTVTVVDTTNFTVGVNITVGGTAAGTVTPVSKRFGFAAYLTVFAFSGTDATITLQESADDGATDAYAGVTSGGFTAITTAPVVERIESSLTQVVERYLRLAITTTGGFSSMDYAVMAVRYEGANRES